MNKILTNIFFLSTALSLSQANGTVYKTTTVKIDQNQFFSKPNDQFFIGFGAGYANLDAKGYAEDTNDDNKKSVHHKFSKRGGIEFRVNGGWTHNYNTTWFSGLELMISYNSAKLKNKYTALPGDERSDKLSQKYSVGLFGTIGSYVSNSVALYGKFGIVNARFDLKHHINGESFSNDQGGKSHKNLWGFSPGVGVKIDMNSNWSFLVESNYTMYQRFKTRDFDEGASAGNLFINSSPKIVSLTANLRYTF